MNSMHFDQEAPKKETFPGIYRGVVIDTKDPEFKNRITVTVPAVNGDASLNWALPCFPVGGSARRPVPGSVVWVMFEHGDADYPVWLGTWIGG